MLEAFLAGELTPKETANLARHRMRSNIPQLIEALGGYMSDHHRFLIRMHFDHLKYLEQATAQHIFVEIGGDIKLFPSEGRLASWIGICPDNNESAGKRMSGHVTKGNRWLKALLVQTAHAASHTRGTYLKAFYHRIAARRGKRRAVVAVAHKQSGTCWLGWTFCPIVQPGNKASFCYLIAATEFSGNGTTCE